jgi:hypothetical protein
MNSTKIVVRKDVSTLASLLLPLMFRKMCGQFLKPRPNERELQEPRHLGAWHRDGNFDRGSPRFIPGWVRQAIERAVFTQLLTITGSNTHKHTHTHKRAFWMHITKHTTP